MKKKYNVINGIYVVDEQATIHNTKSGDYIWDEIEGHTKDRNCMHRRKCYTIAATISPTYIEGITMIEVQDDVELQARQFLIKKWGKEYHTEWEKGFIEGYKAAQQNKYREDDIRKAFIAGQNNRQDEDAYPDEDTYIQSLQKKVIKRIALEVEKHNIGGGYGLAHSQPLQTTYKLVITNPDTNTIIVSPENVEYA